MDGEPRFIDDVPEGEYGEGYDGYDDDFNEQYPPFGYSQEQVPVEPLVEVPDVVADFLRYFRDVLVNKQDVGVIHNIYEQTWNKLTDRFFRNSSWPPVQSVAPLVDEDPLFLTLYKELYYRHIYAKLTPTLEQRFESYENYCDLFNYILGAEQPVPLELPNQWLWDIVDEFVYQFQSYCQYRSLQKNKTDDEIARVNANPQMWHVQNVLHYLHAIVDKSNINPQLIAFREGTDIDTAAGDFGKEPFYQMLGYFSLIGLCRLHCILGDYYQALKVLDNIDLSKKTLAGTGVAACQISTYYYVGFAYLMMRRYQDAIRTLSGILVYIQRTKQYHARSYQFDELMKRNEQMYAMLSMAVSLFPTRIDDHVHSILREKYGERMLKMQRGDNETFEETFAFCCPKFVNPIPPPFDPQNPINIATEAQQKQLKMFMSEVDQQVLLPTVRSYLKLYTTMPISKLAAFMQTDEETFRTYLLLYKHKTRNLVWQSGPPLSGEYETGADVDFYLDNDMIHIADTKVERRYGQYFLRQIGKFSELQKVITRKGDARPDKSAQFN